MKTKPIALRRGERLVTLNYPNGQEQYKVSESLSEAEIRNRATAWLQRNVPGTDMAQVSFVFKPEFPAQVEE